MNNYDTLMPYPSGQFIEFFFFSCPDLNLGTTGLFSEFFESKIRAIFVDNCYDCHGGGQAKGGLSLEGPASMRQGGSSGNPAVVPLDPNKSELMKRVKSALDPMPPNGPQLDEAQMKERVSESVQEFLRRIYKRHQVVEVEEVV